MLKELWGITHQLVNFSLCLPSKLVTLELRSSTCNAGQPHKIVKHAQTIRQYKLKNSLSVFDNFVG